jgi:site-specific DNA-cytosine methylase
MCVAVVFVVMPAVWKASKRSTSSTASGSGEKAWVIESAKWRTTLNMSPNFKPWSSLSSFSGDGVSQTDRVLDILDCVAECKLKTMSLPRTALNVKEHLKDVYCDYSQSHGRHCFTGSKGINHTFTTMTEMYSYCRDSIVLPIEMLLLHGFPKDIQIPDSMTPGQLKTMVGNGMCLPCLATIVHCLDLVKPLGRQ